MIYKGIKFLGGSLKSTIISRYKHIKRYRDILRVLSKNGFGYFTEILQSNIPLIHFRKRSRPTEPISVTAKRLRKVLEELGPAFIKLGQLLSTRPDILPPVFIDQLELLQDNVTPESFQKVEATLKSELGKPISDIFQSIEIEPLATASIGQVHRARLFNGIDVVIKVQRSNVAQQIAVDLEILSDIAAFLESKFDWAKRYRLSSLVDEFSTTLRDELDYSGEAVNATRLRQNLSEFSRIVIPGIHWEYTTAKVLTMDYQTGYKISSEEFFENIPDKVLLAQEIIGALLKQIIVDGFFHADLHPGNLLFTADGRVVLMDFGMVGRLDEHSRDQLTGMLIKGLRKDVDGLVDTLVQMGATENPVDRNGLRREIFYLLDKQYYRSLEQIRVGEVLQEMIRISLKYHIIIPRELIAVSRSIVLLESLVERLDPQLNWIESLTPYSKKLLKERLSPAYLSKKSARYLGHLGGLLRELPDSAYQIIKKMDEGKLQLILEHQHFDRFIQKINLIGNRLSFSLIISALIVGTASLLSQRAAPSFLWHLPIAELGFVVAVFLGIWLLISIIRSRKF